MASGSASVLSSTGNSIAYYAIVEADISSESNTTATITVTAKAQSISTTSSYTYATVYCGSSSTAITTSGKQTPGSTTTFGSASWSYTKTTSSQSVTCKAKVWVPGSSESGLSAGATASCTVTVPALASYTIKYDANGGSGAPSSQTKYYGITLTLSSTKPTRTGYTFQGWGTSSSTSTVTYAAGASYTANAAATLYAVWKADTYTISYDANGGSGAPSSQTKTYGVTLTLSTTKPTRTNYNFLGWSTSKTATSATYAAGGSFTTNADTTLYAVWELAYSSPSISAASVYRVGSSGSSTASAVGGYAYATFTWSIDQTSGTYTAKTLTVKYRASTSTSYTSCTISGTGTGNKSGTTTASFTASTGSSYVVEFSVTDSSGNSNATTTVTRTLSSASYPIHVSKDGAAVGLLSAAPSSGVEIGANTSVTGGSYLQAVRSARYKLSKGLTAANYYYELLRSKYTCSTTSNETIVRIHGHFGEYANTSRRCGYLDIAFSIRNITTSTDPSKYVYVNHVDANINTSYADLLLTIDSSEYAHIYICLAKGYSSGTMYPRCYLDIDDYKETWDYIGDTSGTTSAPSTICWRLSTGFVTEQIVDLETTGTLTLGGAVQSSYGGYTNPVLSMGNSYSYGVELMFGGGSNVFVGAGESMTNLHTALAPGDNENLYLGADQKVYIYSYCNTIANRHETVYDTSGNWTMPGTLTTAGLNIHNAGSTTYTPIYGIYRGTTVISSGSWSSGRATLFSTSNQSSYFGRYLTGANYDAVLVCNGDWNNANSSQTFVAELTDGSSYSSGSVYVRCSDTSLASARRINWVVIKGSS